MVSARELHDQVWGLLDGVGGVTAYDGEIPTTPPLDDDGRVHAYAVLYLSPGLPLALMLDATQDSLAGEFQVTCVGGDPTRALWCVDQVRGALLGATVTIGDHEYEINASETAPGPVRRDDDVRPPRHFVPLIFTVFVP